MKVLHFSALDGGTGAGIAAARIHVGLRERGITSRFCVAYPSVGLPNAFTPRVTMAGRIERQARQALSDWIVRRTAPDYDYVLSTGLVGYDIARIVAQERPDIVQLHWIGGYSFRLRSLAGLKTPVVWRLSDMWAFCGLEHLQPDARRYIDPPGVAAGGLGGFSERLRRRKLAIYQSLPQLYFSCPSRWLLGEARRSALLHDRHLEFIPTGCDIDLFSPKSQQACREALGLPADKSIVLIGATSMGTHWKGMDLFVAAMKKLAAQGENAARPLHVVTFGMDQQGAAELDGLMTVQHFGLIRDRRMMAVLYNAADVLVAPSRMENLSNAVLESLSCGTPVVAFLIGGMPDMIDHKANGFLASPYDAGELAEGIRWAIDADHSQGVRQAARDKIAGVFSPAIEIDRYVDLYGRILASAR